MVGGGQCSSVIVVILTLLGDDRGAPSGWRIIHSNNNNYRTFRPNLRKMPIYRYRDLASKPKRQNQNQNQNSLLVKRQTDNSITEQFGGVSKAFSKSKINVST